MSSFFRRKKHKYETVNDLKPLTYEQIINIDPHDVGFYIKEDSNSLGGAFIGDSIKDWALTYLLELKKRDKAKPMSPQEKQTAINEYMVKLADLEVKIIAYDKNQIARNKNAQRVSTTSTSSNRAPSAMKLGFRGGKSKRRRHKHRINKRRSRKHR